MDYYSLQLFLFGGEEIIYVDELLLEGLHSGVADSLDIRQLSGVGVLQLLVVGVLLLK